MLNFAKFEVLSVELKQFWTWQCWPWSILDARVLNWTNSTLMSCCFWSTSESVVYNFVSFRSTSIELHQFWIQRCWTGLIVDTTMLNLINCVVDDWGEAVTRWSVCRHLAFQVWSWVKLARASLSWPMIDDSSDSDRLIVWLRGCLIRLVWAGRGAPATFLIDLKKQKKMPPPPYLYNTLPWWVR